jgi:K+-transporting ATPase A subunit
VLKNMGTVDRAIRTVIALVVGWLYFTDRVTGTLGIVLLVVAVMFLATSFIGVCPAYLPFKISTKGKGTP